MYCSITDVNALVPQSPFTTQTVPNQAQVQVFITQISNRVDLTLSNIGYFTPVTVGPMSLMALREAVAWGALGLASQARITAIAPDQALGLSVWTKMFDNWMSALADAENPFELTDAIRTSKQVVKPVGEIMTDSTVSSIDSGMDSDPVNYLSNAPYDINMKFVLFVVMSIGALWV